MQLDVQLLQRAQTAARIQRESMVTFIDQIVADNLFWTSANEDLKMFKADILKKDWGMLDVIKAKRELSKVDKEYYAAMVPVDPGVFMRRYPDIDYNIQAGK
jgi:hypothetical protein